MNNLPKEEDLRIEIEKAIGSLPTTYETNFILPENTAEFIPYLSKEILYTFFDNDRDQIVTSYVPKWSEYFTGFYTDNFVILDKLKFIPNLTLECSRWGGREIGRGPTKPWINDFKYLFNTATSFMYDKFYKQCFYLNLPTTRSELQLNNDLDVMERKFPNDKFLIMAGYTFIDYLKNFTNSNYYRGYPVVNVSNFLGRTTSIILAKSQVKLKVDFEYEYSLKRVPYKYEFYYAGVSKIHLEIDPENQISSSDRRLPNRFHDLE